MSTGTETFRALHHGEVPLLLPNAWDYASAAALAAAGFAAVGTTSLGVAAAHGLPDARGQARAETLGLARLIGRLAFPVTVDVEAGFSDDPAEVAALAVELRDTGVVGINIEDGRPGAALADPRRQQELISAVKAAVPDLFLNARIDTHWLAGEHPPPPAETRARAERYVAAGADGIFVPGLTAEREIADLVTGIPVPINLLFRPGSHSVGRLAGLGVRRISTGSLLFRAALHAAVDTALAVRDDGPVDDVLSYAEIERLTGGP